MTTEQPADIPRQGVLLGLDYGRKRIGVAITTTSQSIALPLVTIPAMPVEVLESELRHLAREHRAVAIVVGLPVHMSGEDSEMAREVRAFGERVHRITGLPVAYFDERLTSTLAEQSLRAGGLTEKKRRARRDRIAAQIMLQHFLDRHRG
ncbi:MAG: Holliday junction resolvase RuvX [Planctomycetota bacterium]|nr:MAG: Holliday junction resolvase RuvX [Planctomycetota bacterium]